MWPVLYVLSAAYAAYAQGAQPSVIWFYSAQALPHIERVAA